jgi:peptidoglycan/LPS O-acetylase OafA/YrhL
LDHVDGIRAAAALIVFLNHAYGQVWNRYWGFSAEGILGPTEYSLVIGHLSVTVFIVVSGFCLALPVVDHGDRLRGGTKEFFKRRARRILPPYYAALLVCLALIATLIGTPTGTIWDVPIEIDKVAMVSHLLLLQDLFGTGRINYVFWSIAVEWHIYFAMPLLVWAIRKYGVLRVVPVVMAFGYALTFGLEHTRVSRAHPHFLGMFALGMLAAYLVRSPHSDFQRLRERVPWGVLTAIAFGCTVAMIVGYGLEVALDRFAQLDLPVGIMAAALLVHTTRASGSVAQRAFSFRPLVAIGTFSYSVYLMHAPVLQLLWQYLLTPLGMGRDAQFIFLMTGGLCIVLGISYAFHLVFEAPFMRSPAPQVAVVKA